MSATVTAAVPASDLDPFSDEFLANPYPAHERLREAGPVVLLDRYGVWAMARFEHVKAALGAPVTYCSSAGVGLSDFRRETPWRPPSLLLEADPPDHTRARRVIAAALSTAAVRDLRAGFTREANRLVGNLLERGRFDAVTDLAAAFPLTAFADAVGLPPDGRENLLPYGEMVFNGFGPRNHLFTTAMAGGAAVADWIVRHCRRDGLSPDGIGARIHDSAEREGYSPDHAALLVRSFLSAGVDTTVHALANAMLCFTEHPAQWALVRAEPALVRSAFDEAVRFESPVQTFFRTTTRTVEVGGTEIPAGVKVLLFLGAANRDPRRWPDADRFDVTRRAAGQVGFGSGIHNCVGQVLARLEGEVLLGALAERVRTIETAGPPVRRLNNTLRGLDSLLVTVR